MDNYPDLKRIQVQVYRQTGKDCYQREGQKRKTETGRKLKERKKREEAKDCLHRGGRGKTETVPLT